MIGIACGIGWLEQVRTYNFIQEEFFILLAGESPLGSCWVHV